MPRTLFSVVEVTPDEGEPFRYVDWHPDFAAVQEAINENGQMTDKVLDIADEFLEALAEDGGIAT